MKLRERKREADEMIEPQESKKPRLASDVDDETAMITDIAATEPGPGEQVLTDDNKSEELRGVETSSSRSKTQLSETAGSGNGFKENPYTFLSEGDEAIVSCMLVHLPTLRYLTNTAQGKTSYQIGLPFL